MKLRRLIAVTAAAAVGCLIVRDILHKATVKMLISEDAFEACNEENISCQIQPNEEKSVK